VQKVIDGDHSSLESAPRPTRTARPTMADVARMAGVSSTAVSFVLNGRADGSVSPETRSRVLDAIEALGYRPNRAAQGLRTRKTRTIGFVTDEIAATRPAGRTIAGVHDVARRHGSLLLIVNATRDARVLRREIEDLIDRQVDAIAFAVVGTRRATLPEAAHHVPTVLVNCFAPRNVLPCILPNDADGGRAATELLLSEGHRDIAYLTGLPGAWATRQRLKGYRAALRRAGIDYDDRLVLTGNFGADSGYDLTRRLLARKRRPTAIFCGNDRMALGAYLALKEAGVRVPKDMSVVGYDDQEDLAPEVRPPLTTIRLPYYEMGRWAADQLLAGAVGHLPPRTYAECPPISRASVGPPPR
jgi:LacI family transcriptional regulator